MDKLEKIYKKMLAAKEQLEKARQKMADEYDPNEDPYEGETEYDGTDRDFDPDEESDDADKWLAENDPAAAKPADEYSEYEPDEDDEAHRAAIDEDMGSEDSQSPMESPAAQQQAAPAAREAVAQGEGKKSRWQQPSREDLMSMRQYTRPWEQRAREAQQLKADPSKNPQLARQGNIVEARNASHGDRNAAYREYTNSPDYKNADPIQQMEMDDQFENNWKQQNPEHLKNALNAHHEAHEKGKGAKDIHAAAKDAQIRNIISGGGHGGEGYSLEEGMQHAGGTKGEEGTQATVKQDPATSFAMGNQDFLRQYGEDYKNKGKKVGNIDEMSNYDEGAKRDVKRILGEGPSKNPQFEKFFEHYHPMIGMSAKKALNTLGLDANHPDIDHSMLHEAGMHGLIQAMNDYDHDNPSKASFATHAGNKIRGLQMTALKNQDAVPTEVRAAQKKFASGKASPQAPKVDLKSVIQSSGHPKAPDMADRLQRVGSQRQAQAIKVRKPPTSGGQGGGI